MILREYVFCHPIAPILAALIFGISSVPAASAVNYALHLEDTPDSTPQANLASLTAGTIFLGTDRFLSVWDHPTVDVADLYLYTGIDNTGFNFGVAKTWGNIYLACFYGGKLFDDLVPLITGSRLGNIVTYDPFHSKISSTVAAEDLAVRNNAVVLFSYKNAALRLSYNESIHGTDMVTDDFFDQAKGGATDFSGKKANEVTADLVPGIDLAAWWHLTDNTLFKAAAGVTYTMHQHSADSATATFDSATGVPAVTTEQALRATYTKPGGYVSAGLDFGVEKAAQYGFTLTGGYAWFTFQNLHPDTDTLTTAIFNGEDNYTGTDSEMYGTLAGYFQAFVHPRASLKVSADATVALGLSNKTAITSIDSTNYVQTLITVVPRVGAMLNTVALRDKLTIHTAVDGTLHRFRLNIVTADPPPDPTKSTVRTETLYLPEVLFRAGLTFHITPALSTTVIVALSTQTAGVENVLVSTLYRPGKRKSFDRGTIFPKKS